jgi:hypothetical protein
VHAAPAGAEQVEAASQIREVVMVAADPLALRDLYVALQGSSRVEAADGLCIVTARGLDRRRHPRNVRPSLRSRRLARVGGPVGLTALRHLDLVLLPINGLRR